MSIRTLLRTDAVVVKHRIAVTFRLGAGLVGGMLIEDAIDHHDQDVYRDGYSQSLPFPHTS